VINNQDKMPELNRKIQPHIQLPVNLRLTDPEILTLKNGVRVVMFNAGTQELVRIEMIFNAGSWFQEKNFISLATNLMIREGTKKRSSQEIAGLLDYYGAHLETTAEKDNAYVSLYSLNKHLEHTLPVLAELIREAAFPQDEYGIFAAKQKQMLEVNLQKVNFIARTRFNSLLYGKSHPYGNFLLSDDIGEISHRDLVAFHRDYYHGGNCVIMVAGKINPSVIKWIENTFSGTDWLLERKNHQAYVINASPEKEFFIPKEGALQSAIRMGRILFDQHHPDYPGMKVLTTLLGGYFGSRLMTNLREDKGFTYGIGSAMIPMIHSGYFFISCEVGAEVTSNAIHQIRSELTRLMDQPVHDKELDLVRNYMIGAFIRGIDGPFAMADSYRDIMEHGLTNEFYYKMLETIRNITPNELRDLAGKYLDPSGMHLLVVGKHPSG
jgi:predicted Zn-dependent peptidase